MPAHIARHPQPSNYGAVFERGENTFGGQAAQGFAIAILWRIGLAGAAKGVAARATRKTYREMVSSHQGSIGARQRTLMK